jgi:hypothetical protein
MVPTALRNRAGPLQSSAQMLKTFSLSVAFFLTIGLLFAAYASVPI